MKRRTLDLMFSTGAAVLAGLFVILGLVLSDRADFANDYVGDQLALETLEFPAEDALDPREIEFTEARSGCVIANAGQPVTTGKDAECYANEYLGGHLTWLATRLGMTQIADVDGMNYLQLGQEQGRIRTEIATVEESDPATVPALEQRLEDVTTLRAKMFEGTMLKNALLTSYGFGEFGSTADTSSTIAYGAAGLLLLLAIAGFAHAYVTPKSKTLGIPGPTDDQVKVKEPVSV